MSDEAAETAAEPRRPAPERPAPERRPVGPPPEPTGDPRVDTALARLAELGGAPVAEHVEIFEDVHQRLQELLASADQDEPARPGRFPDALRPAPAPAPPAPPAAPRPGPPQGWTAQGRPEGRG